MLNLKNKIAIVTGASSGIGKAIATTFVKAGASVFLADINEEGGLEACNELEKINSDTNFLKTDVSKENDVKQLVLLTEEKFKWKINPADN